MIAQRPITKQVDMFVKQTEKLTLSEKQNLFWIILEKFSNDDALSYSVIDIKNTQVYILPHLLSNNKPNQRKQLRQPGALKNMIEYIAPDFDEPLDDFNEFM